MKRIYACLAIVAALLVIAFYSSFRVQQFAEEISEDLDNAMGAIRDEDLTGARQALAEGAELCDRMREGMNHLLRTEDFTELEAALRAADGHLEWNAPEEAFGELRRAQVQVETLAWLAQRHICTQKSAPPTRLENQTEAVRFCLFNDHLLRLPISFFSSLKKLSTSANCW